MAIVGTARPLAVGREGEELENGRKVFHRTYFVQTDTSLDGPNAVLGAPGLPALGDKYDGHPSAVCIGRYPRPLDNTRYAWHVDCVWDTHSVDRDENPLNQNPEIEFGFEAFDEPLMGSEVPGAPADKDDPSGTQNADGSAKTIGATVFHMGQGIVNSAGDPFDPPPTRLNFYPCIRFTRNESAFTPLYALQYGNTVNVSSWCGLLARQAWLKPIEATHEVQHADGLDKPDIQYWRVRYTFLLRAMTWDLFVLNIGPNYLNLPNTTTPSAAGPKKIPFINAGTRDKDLLKADGTRYEATETKVPTWRRFPIMRAVEFSGLGINLNLSLPQLRNRNGPTTPAPGPWTW